MPHFVFIGEDADKRVTVHLTLIARRLNLLQDLFWQAKNIGNVLDFVMVLGGMFSVATSCLSAFAATRLNDVALAGQRVRHFGRIQLVSDVGGVKILNHIVVSIPVFHQIRVRRIKGIKLVVIVHFVLSEVFWRDSCKRCHFSVYYDCNVIVT